MMMMMMIVDEKTWVGKGLSAGMSLVVPSAGLGIREGRESSHHPTPKLPRSEIFVFARTNLVLLCGTLKNRKAAFGTVCLTRGEIWNFGGSRKPDM